MKIIGIGEVVWDCLPDGKKLGGAPINFSFFAKESGADSYPISAKSAYISDSLLRESLFISSYIPSERCRVSF